MEKLVGTCQFCAFTGDAMAMLEHRRTAQHLLGAPTLFVVPLRMYEGKEKEGS